VIDWWGVARHAVWIIGAAIVVASWSFQRALISRYAFFGAVLFCLGMASVSRWWESVLWITLPFVLRWKPRP
jgi:hypothetical protein